MKYMYNWDEESKCATCIIQEGNETFYGLATCHPDDEDMMSKTTGLEIATRRAEIKYYKYLRNTIKIKLSSLNQLYYSMKHSKKFNEKSYENKMLQRQIHILNRKLITIKENIVIAEENLKMYIDSKDKFYQTIRARRGNRVKVNPILDENSTELRKLLNNIDVLDKLQQNQ